MSKTDKNAPAAAETSAGGTAAESKITVYRFLQVRPKPTGYGTLLRKHYGQELHTIDEWEGLLQKILDRTVN